MSEKNGIKRKKILAVIAGILFIFAVINVIWYFIIYRQYDKYTEAVPKNDMDIYAATDADGFSYNVKKPDYLSFDTGNLGVFESIGNGLIIWPNTDDDHEYGFMIEDNDVTYQIYVDDDLEAINSEDQEIVDRNKDLLKTLFEKADAKWGILK